MRTSWAIGLVLLIGNESSAQWEPVLNVTRARLRGLAIVSEKVVWACGTSGTFIRTDDGGVTWKSGHVEGAEDLDFRDIHGCGRSQGVLAVDRRGTKISHLSDR